jgi:hypothetical protein
VAEGYWILLGCVVLLIVCLGVVAYQRDTARADLETYRQRLAAVDPEEARTLAWVLGRG